MKKVYTNVFDFNVTTMQSDGEEFRIGRISEELAERVDRFKDRVEQVQQKATMPCGVLIFKFILNLVWICVFGGILQAWGNGNSFKQIYKNVPVMVQVGVGAFVLWLLLGLIGFLKKNKAYGEVDSQSMEQQVKTMEQQLRMEMDIPEDAKLVDILCQCFEIKKGKKKLVMQPSSAAIYMRNTEMYVWRKEECIYFCDRIDLFAIPVSRFGEAELLKKPPVQVSGWNKEEPINDEKYKAFKPYENGNGIYIKQHYILPVKGQTEDMVIRIPNYDFVVVKSLIDEG